MRRPAYSLADDLRHSRYELLAKIASGGMATVYVGRLRGAEGFYRLVAIKRAHPHLLEDPSFRQVVVAEARLAARIYHPHVVSVQDVEERDGELLLVMDYIEGASLSGLLNAGRAAERPLPARVAVRACLDAALGLHAAHELTDDAGRPLGLVHRDVSPQNILVGQDGSSRISDFGIAKCVTSGVHSAGTQMGVLKGKLPYMAPEYVEHSDVDLRGDVFALGVVLWESLTGQRLFRADNDFVTMRRVAMFEAPLVSTVAPELPPALDQVLAKALEKAPGRRWSTARAFAEALEAAGRGADLVATATEVGDYVRAVAGGEIARRRALVRDRAGEPQTPVSAERAVAARAEPESARSSDAQRAAVELSSAALPPGDVTVTSSRHQAEAAQATPPLASLGAASAVAAAPAHASPAAVAPHSDVEPPAHTSTQTRTPAPSAVAEIDDEASTLEDESRSDARSPASGARAAASADSSAGSSSSSGSGSGSHSVSGSGSHSVSGSGSGSGSGAGSGSGSGAGSGSGSDAAVATLDDGSFVHARYDGAMALPDRAALEAERAWAAGGRGGTVRLGTADVIESRTRARPESIARPAEATRPLTLAEAVAHSEDASRDGGLRMEPTLSTLDRSGVSSQIASESAADLRALARKRSARLGVFVGLGALALATAAIVAARVGGPGASPAGAASVAPAPSAAAASAAVTAPAADGPAASASARAASSAPSSLPLASPAAATADAPVAPGARAGDAAAARTDALVDDSAAAKPGPPPSRIGRAAPLLSARPEAPRATPSATPAASAASADKAPPNPYADPKPRH